MASAMDHRETLRRLAIRDDAFVESVLGNEPENVSASALDPKSHALVQIAAFAAADAAPASYISSVEAALRHGASPEEIVGVLVAVMPAVGTSRAVSAAPKLGLALGYDVADALEEPPLGRSS
jgi:4-carboxymuconolactone decarboxylase